MGDVDVDVLEAKFVPSQYHYRLAAIIVRRGDASGGASGHYYAYIRGAIDWIKCDDHNVDVVNEDEMLKIAKLSLAFSALATFASACSRFLAISAAC